MELFIDLRVQELNCPFAEAKALTNSDRKPVFCTSPLVNHIVSP
ncbi:hypothetical protein [Funiculus sociatus]